MNLPILGISTPGQRDVTIDVDRLIETRLLINANSGAGKSWCLRRILEQTHGRLQHLVIDPEGEFHTLREKFDYVLVARQGGDCLADPRSAGLLATRLLELGVSAILDIYELHADERKRFVRLFLESLINAPRELWHPALVVVDEAHVFAPEAGDAESAGPVKDLMTRGRKRGFCGLLATQRLSKLHKDASAEANNVLIGRASQDVDMKRAAYLLGFAGREEQARLRTLEAGHFFAFGPAIAATGVIELQVGPVATTHPKAGQRSTAPAPARETVKQVLAKLADLPKEADAKIQTEAELRKRVTELERELAKQPAPPANPVTVEALNAARVEGFACGNREGFLAAIADAKRVFIPLQRAAEKAVALLQASIPEGDYDPAPPPGSGYYNSPPSRKLDQPIQPIPSQLGQRTPPANANGHSDIGAGGLRRILIALAQCPNGLSAKQIGIRAGLSSSSGTFGTYLGKARSSGWIEGGRDHLHVTREGIAALGSYDPLPTGRELLEHWLRELGESGAARMLTALAARYPESLTAEELGTAAEISASSGTFGTYLGKLRTLELISGGRSELRASDDLFS